MDVNGMMQLVQMLMGKGPSMSEQFLGSAADDEIPIQMLHGKSPSKSPHRALPPVQTTAGKQQLALPDMAVDGNKEPVAEEKPGKDLQDGKPEKQTMNAPSATVDDTTDMLVAALANRTRTLAVVRKRPASQIRRNGAAGGGCRASQAKGVH
jgi:hypothetical protein